MCDIFKNEFRFRNAWFGHYKPEAFYMAQWRWHSAVYLTYRTIVACYSVACFLALLLLVGQDDSMAYLTIWTYLILCLYQISSLFTSIFCYVTRQKRTGNMSDSATYTKTDIPNGKETVVAVRNAGYVEESEKETNGIVSNNSLRSRSLASSTDVLLDNQKKSTTWYMKLTWFLGNILYVFGIIVTLVYFTALFPSIGVTDGFIHDLNMHAFNSLQILIDIVIVARPVRLLHVIYPFLYGACYLIFSVIYWSEDKKNNVLYPGVLDWNEPRQTGIFMGLLAVLGIPLLQLIFFGIFRLRLYVYKHTYGTDYLD